MPAHVNSRDTIPIRPYYKSGIISPEYHDLKVVDVELWLRVKLE